MILLSYIIPTYNRSNLLSHFRPFLELIQSDKLPIEVIFIDDFSTDKTLSILDSLQSEFECVSCSLNSMNKGVQGARNSGLHLASGEYVCFFDDDDEVILENLPSLIHILQNRQDLEVVFCNGIVENQDRKEFFLSSENKQTLPKRFLSFLSRYTDVPFMLQGTFYKRSFILKYECSFNLEVNKFQDVHFNLSVLKKKPKYLKLFDLVVFRWKFHEGERISKKQVSPQTLQHFINDFGNCFTPEEKNEFWNSLIEFSLHCKERIVLYNAPWSKKTLALCAYNVANRRFGKGLNRLFYVLILKCLPRNKSSNFMKTKVESVS